MDDIEAKDKRDMTGRFLKGNALHAIDYRGVCDEEKRTNAASGSQIFHREATRRAAGKIDILTEIEELTHLPDLFAGRHFSQELVDLGLDDSIATLRFLGGCSCADRQRNNEGQRERLQNSALVLLLA